MSILPGQRQEPGKTDLAICPDAALAREAARRFVVAAKDSIGQRDRFMVALSGGRTPQSLYQLLSTEEWSAHVDWSKTHLFWGDERFVPQDDAQSNHRMARQALLSRIAIPPANVHPVPTGSGTAEEAAAAYERTLREVFGGGKELPRFDLILLGLGENGHTASLFPGSTLLRETVRLVAAEFVTEAGNWRITMTLPLINHARKIMFLVAGAEKAEMLRRVLAGEFEAGAGSPWQYPAQLVQPDQGTLLWLVDSAAARLLPRQVA
jgi:6-phosphogluconolactonase